MSNRQFGNTFFRRSPRTSPAPKGVVLKPPFIDSEAVDRSPTLEDEGLLEVQQALRQMGYRRNTCTECGCANYQEMPGGCSCGTEDYETEVDE